MLVCALAVCVTEFHKLLDCHVQYESCLRTFRGLPCFNGSTSCIGSLTQTRVYVQTSLLLTSLPPSLRDLSQVSCLRDVPELATSACTPLLWTYQDRRQQGLGHPLPPLHGLSSRSFRASRRPLIQRVAQRKHVDMALHRARLQPFSEAAGEKQGTAGACFEPLQRSK